MNEKVKQFEKIGRDKMKSVLARLNATQIFESEDEFAPVDMYATI